MNEWLKTYLEKGVVTFFFSFISYDHLCYETLELKKKIYKNLIFCIVLTGASSLSHLSGCYIS